jgi:hypothetical protein
MKKSVWVLGIALALSAWAHGQTVIEGGPQGTLSDQVPGAEIAAGANLSGKNVKAEGTIFIPDSARRVRAVIVLVESWPGAERGAVDLATGLLRGGARPFVDLAVGRFRDMRMCPSSPEAGDDSS